MTPIKGDLLEVDNVVLGVEIRTPDDDYRFDADIIPYIPGYPGACRKHFRLGYHHLTYTWVPTSEVLKNLAVIGTECARIIKTVFIEFSRPTSDILWELSEGDAP